MREAFALEAGGSSLVVTPEHPVFDPASGGFFAAREWLTGARHTMMVASPFFAGVADVSSHHSVGQRRVFDLTVDHAWHTFIAGGVVVHNKQPPGCTNETGELVTRDQTCPCDGGVGFRQCGLSGFAPCTRCGRSVDGGSLDAGGLDGGDGR